MFTFFHKNSAAAGAATAATSRWTSDKTFMAAERTSVEEVLQARTEQSPKHVNRGGMHGS